MAVGITGNNMDSSSKPGEPRTELKGFCIVLSFFYMIFSLMIFGTGLAAYRYGQDEEHVDAFNNVVFRTPGGPEGHVVVSGMNRDEFMSYACICSVGGLLSLGISLVFFNGLMTRNVKKCKLWIRANLAVSIIFTIFSLYRLGEGSIEISLLGVAIFIFNLVCVAIASAFVVEIEIAEANRQQQILAKTSKKMTNKPFVIDLKEEKTLPATHKV